MNTDKTWFGFGKTDAHNMELLANLERLDVQDLPIMAGLSRKRTLGNITGRDVSDRLAAGVAAAPVLNVADLLHNPHYRARDTFIEVRHPLGFTETIYGSYVKPSRTVPDVRPGPAMGQDNERVLCGILGLSDADYDHLVAEGVID